MSFSFEHWPVWNRKSKTSPSEQPPHRLHLFTTFNLWHEFLCSKNMNRHFFIHRISVRRRCFFTESVSNRDVLKMQRSWGSPCAFHCSAGERLLSVIYSRHAYTKQMLKTHLQSSLFNTFQLVILSKGWKWIYSLTIFISSNINIWHDAFNTS